MRFIMADQEPTYYTLPDFKGTGMDQLGIWVAIYNIYLAVYAICNNIDEDTGSTGTDYLSKIGTDLATAMAGLRTPTSVKTV
jgi:hypothetical protein